MFVMSKIKTKRMRKNIALVASVFLLSGSVYAQNVASPEKPKAYIVSNAHLDTQWNWDIQTTIKEYVWNTINQNLMLLKQYPNYVFNFEGGAKYAWMKEYFPIQYEEVKKYIKTGRWHVSGASWDATDVLVPSIESSLRNIMLGQDYYRKEFGVESTDIFLPDCFGFGWTLPTIASHCGLIGFSSQKLKWRTNPFYGKSKYPFTIGLWTGVDGSTIMMAHGEDYNKRWKEEDLSNNKDLLKFTSQSPLNIAYRYYGTGDIGGSPTLESVRAVEKGVKGSGPVEIISATSDQLYKDFQPYGNHPELPQYNGELLMDVHGTGCYTSQAAMKLYNRQNELLADAAERSSVVADWLNQACYPGNAFTEIWRRFILHQFHDDLTGTSIPRAYEFSWNDELISLQQLSGILTSSVDAVVRQMNTKTKGMPVVIYNSLGYDVTDLAEVEIETSKAPKDVSVYNADGKKVPAQLLSYTDGKAKLLLEATVPAVGYAVYDVRISGSSKHSVISSDASVLENSIYKLSLDQNGDVVSLFDKKNNKELVKEGKAIRLALFTDNKSYVWPAWEIKKTTIDTIPQSITDDVKITVLENGILRKSICVEKRYGESNFKQYIRMYEGSRADRIDFYNEVDWQSTNSLLKAEFPLNVTNQNATYDLGLGSIERGNNTTTAYEVYAHQWTDLTDRDNSYGVTVLNDCKYGWDKPDDNTIRLTLLNTPGTNKRYIYQNKQDLGYHTFTYSLVGHSGKLEKPEAVRKSDLLNQKLKAFSTEKHQGALGKEFSFASSSNNNVIIKAIKKAENSDEYVVRVYEIGGEKEQKATIVFAGNIVEACEADGTEKKIAQAQFSDNSLSFSIKPFSIKTFKVRLTTSGLKRFELQYASLPLKYDQKCSSFNEFRAEGDFDAGYSYAAELWPSELNVDQIPFKLGEKDIANGMSCKGDTLYLPQGETYNKLYVLAAATDGDYMVPFKSGHIESKVYIPSYTGFIGQWGHTGHTKGYLKKANVAFVGTHRHSSTDDEPYNFTYMFKVGIDIPKGARSIILPTNEKVVLFAATLVNELIEPVKVASTHFNTAIKENTVHLNDGDIKYDNLLKGAKVIGFSGSYNEREKPHQIIDGNYNTKWCDVGKHFNYADFDLGESKSLTGWKLVNAGREDKGYVTSACFLLGRNSLDEEWQPLDNFDDNRQNIVQRTMKSPAKVRYVRLMITRPMQNADGDVLRINEFELF